MLILTFKTDEQLAQIELYDDHELKVHREWQAHRQLAETIHTKIVDVLMEADHRLHELQGIAVFRGPGSFTGLRIGVSTANALAYALDIPIASGTGEQWTADSVAELLAGKNEFSVTPEYGSAPHITMPKH
jgi:tRNA threonylcarbamoyladenosine biosynthesis protein TsaB